MQIHSLTELKPCTMVDISQAFVHKTNQPLISPQRKKEEEYDHQRRSAFDLKPPGHELAKRVKQRVTFDINGKPIVHLQDDFRASP